MSYSEWLNSLITPIQAFLGWASTITTALLGNYIFISFVGLVVITSLFSLFLDYFLNFNILHRSKKKNLDNGGKK